MTIIAHRVRTSGWEQAVRDLLSTYPAQPYEFGTHDCFQLFLAVERAMYGSSLWDKRYTTYSSNREALVNLRGRVKTRNPMRFIDKVYERIAPEDAQLGDMTFQATFSGLPHVYLFDGAQWVTFAADTDPVPRAIGVDAVRRAWRL